MTTRVGWIPCIGAPPPLGTATYLPKKKRFLNEGKGGAKFGAPETLVSWFMQYSVFLLNCSVEWQNHYVEFARM